MLRLHLGVALWELFIDSGGGVEKWLDSRYILMVELEVLDDCWDVENEIKEWKMIATFFFFLSWETEGEEVEGGADFILNVDSKSPVMDMWKFETPTGLPNPGIK